MSIQQHHYLRKYLSASRSSIYRVSPTFSHTQRAFIRTSYTWWTRPFTSPGKESKTLSSTSTKIRVMSGNRLTSHIATSAAKRSQAQYDISDLVADEVLDTIESITEYCGQFANPQTRLNGFSALRKIGKTIALSTNDTLGREVQERFQSGASLVDGMMKIINFMTPVEVRVIIEHKSNPNALWSKLQELEELAQNECIHPGIEEVLNLLDPARDEYEEEIDEDEDEDDVH